MKKTLNIVFAIVLTAVFLLPAKIAYAASARMYLSPSGSTVYNGSTVSIGVRENSNTSVDSVQANLSYPTDKFDFVRIDSSSAFGVVAQNSGGNGHVSIARGALPAVSGDQLVASVVFRAKTGSGSATVSIAGGSEIDSGGKNVMTSSSGGSYKLATAPPAVAAAPKDTKPPKINNISANGITTQSAIIKWTTSEPATSEVRYGPTQDYGLVASNDKKVTEHKVILNSPVMQAGTQYHFMVKSVDAAGNAATSNDQNFTTQGAVLNITVVNQKNKPVEGANVKILNQSSTSDKEGRLILSNLPTGTQTATVEYHGQKTVKDIEISKTASEKQPQAVTIQIKTPKAHNWLLGLFGLMLIIIATMLFKASRREGPPVEGLKPPKSDSLFDKPPVLKSGGPKAKDKITATRATVKPAATPPKTPAPPRPKPAPKPAAPPTHAPAPAPPAPPPTPKPPTPPAPSSPANPPAPPAQQ